jgi:hypothetical protein
MSLRECFRFRVQGSVFRVSDIVGFSVSFEVLWGLETVRAGAPDDEACLLIKTRSVGFLVVAAAKCSSMLSSSSIASCCLLFLCCQVLVIMV